MNLLRKVFPYIGFFLLFQSGGGLLFKFERNLATLLMTSLLVVLLFFGKIRLNASWVKAFLVVSSVFLTFLCLNFIFANTDQSLRKYLYFLLSYFTALFFLQYSFFKYTKYQFLKIIKDILVFFMLHALLSAFFHLFFSFPFRVKDPESDYTVDSFLYIFYSRSDEYGFKLFGLDFVRNQGLFWEPGALQFYLNVLLYIFLFVEKKKNNFLLIFFTIIAIISTYSTTGLILMGLQLIIYSPRFLRSKTGTYLLPFALVGGVLFAVFLSSNLSLKFLGERTTSTNVRLYDFFQQLSIVIDNPILGVGYDSEQYEKLRSEYDLLFSVSSGVDKIEGKERGSTNSLMYVFATMGIPMGLAMFLGLFYSPFFTKNRMVIGLITIVSVSAEPIMLKPLFLFFICAGVLNIYYSAVYNKKSLWHLDEFSSQEARGL